MLGTDWHQAEQVCNVPLNYITGVGGKVFTFDARMFTYDWTGAKNPFVKYLTTSKKTQELYKSLHIDQSTKNPVFVDSSD